MNRRPPLDLTNLRNLTEGNAEAEKKIFSMFVSSGQDCIDVLRVECIDGPSEPWRAMAHKLKGISLNIGANYLAELCKVAQLGFERDIAAKQEMLDLIEDEFEAARKYLESVYSS